MRSYRTVYMLATAAMLSGCGDMRDLSATCTRISNGEVLRATARVFNGDVQKYDMNDRNGLYGEINATNSGSFICKLADQPA